MTPGCRGGRISRALSPEGEAVMEFTPSVCIAVENMNAPRCDHASRIAEGAGGWDKSTLTTDLDSRRKSLGRRV